MSRADRPQERTRPTRWAWIKAILSEDGPPGSTMRLALLGVASHLDLQGDGAFPSIPRLARETELGISTLKRDLADAENYGWIVREKRGRGYMYRASLPEPNGPRDRPVEDDGHVHEIDQSPGPGNTRQVHDVDLSEPEQKVHEIDQSAPDPIGLRPGSEPRGRPVPVQEIDQSPPVGGKRGGIEGSTTTSLRSGSNDPSLRADGEPSMNLLRFAAKQGDEVGPTWKHEHPVANEIVGWWIDLRNGARPPGSEIAKQGVAARRLGQNHTRADIIRAMIGIGQLYPHSDGEPFDLFDLERKFTKAHDAFERHPAVQKWRFLKEMAEEE